MTEETGFIEESGFTTEPSPEVPAPAPEAEAEVAGEASPVQEEAPVAGDVTEAPDAPWVPDGQPEWLRLLIDGIDKRLRALGG